MEVAGQVVESHLLGAGGLGRMPAIASGLRQLEGPKTAMGLGQGVACHRDLHLGCRPRLSERTLTIRRDAHEVPVRLTCDDRIGPCHLAFPNKLAVELFEPDVDLRRPLPAVQEACLGFVQRELGKAHQDMQLASHGSAPRFRGGRLSASRDDGLERIVCAGEIDRL